ncbi:hypothetical protein [Varunaivibrio sulfuroxidans]|uniref:Uncharacterized protein n=1 Tax=Varunaivibrio sulfuroxidans TaxID=1773489 RepID=A0A4R3J757_9PROT|nr:hypothetical protein [Varunaivibrio sulfuroxidans]TCS61688.1 hypothetical protein EDD55_10797 [Varunaivibrio sulfuroxidans]WES32129.1 hypothetical protein P3M64_07160 [Varunaivibrio sulfuroxidans]
MSLITVQKTSFASGELSPHLLGRGDLSAYDNGAMKLRNVFIHPTGGLTRRSGLRHVATARGNGRLVAFEFNVAQIYLFVFSDGFVEIYHGDVKETELATPWTAAQIAELNWVQSADTMLVVHPDVPPKKIVRSGAGVWALEDWVYVEKAGRRFVPHHKFTDGTITLQASATTGTITVTASAAVFQAGHVGCRFRLQDKDIEITSVSSATSAQASVKETLVSIAPSEDWEEQAFSTVRGWPRSVCFHQDRMVIGGSRDEPNRLWMSKSSDILNFDLGTGLDDEAIEFAILSDQINAIRAVFSGRHLQIFTSGAEWMVSGEPLTPSSVQIKRQTRVGSLTDRTVPPRDVDGATLFSSRSGHELREFLFTDVEQAYQAVDLALLARHLINAPRDQDFDKKRRLFHQVMGDGTIATVTVYRAEKVTAWSAQQTQGAFRSIAVVGDQTYVLVLRGAQYNIEAFDETLNVDGGVSMSAAAPQDVWSGLSHLDGMSVKVFADDTVHADALVSAGQITLSYPASTVVAGLGYAHVIEPMPPSVATQRGGVQGGKVRPISVTFRLENTGALYLDTGKGLAEIPFKRFGQTYLDAPIVLYTGDKTVRALGWRRNGIAPLWRIEQDTPLPFTLLSVTTEMNINA